MPSLIAALRENLTLYQNNFGPPPACFSGISLPGMMTLRPSTFISRYGLLVSGPLACAIVMCSCPKYGITRARFSSLNRITSSIVRTRAFGPRDARYLFKSALNS